MKRGFCFIFFLFTYLPVIAQQSTQKVFFSDIDNFWVAYDSIRSTSDSLRQLAYLQRLYIGKGTPGLKSFMEARSYTAAGYVGAIRHYPKYWNSIRPFTQRARTAATAIEPYLDKFRKLYPALHPASIYFTIGLFRSGGTVKDGAVLIGAELATGGPGVDVSEFPARTKAFLSQYYQTDHSQSIVELNVHEYVHTQEGESGNSLLGQALYEGTCDLIAELVTGRVPALPYTTYGPAHEPELKAKFKAEMFSPSISNWFYNQLSDDPQHVADLGYYMGYRICKTYYQRAKNKQAAIKRLIELNHSSDAAVEALLRETNYYPEPLDKAQLLRAYATHNPMVVRMTPALSPDGLLDVSVKELRFTFSTAMGPNVSTGLGPGGREQFPVTDRLGFSPDRKSFTYKVDLKPGRTYGFILEGGGFEALDGHPLVPYEVKFSTKE